MQGKKQAQRVIPGAQRECEGEDPAARDDCRIRL